MRGDVHRLRAPRGSRGHEQRGARYAVILQADDLMLSTVIVAPTSLSAAGRVFRPRINVAGEDTHVQVEQTAGVDRARLGPLVGHVTRAELEAIDGALRLVLGLD